MTELSEHIKAKASSSPGDTDDSSEFVGFFPTFVWAVRDFTLQLEEDGQPITEDDYLEHALELKKGTDGRCSVKIYVVVWIRNRSCWA